MRIHISTVAPILIFLAFVVPLKADDGSDTDTRYKKAYHTLASADETRDTGDITKAVTLYREALAAYRSFGTEHPGAHKSVVQFRIAYCDNQLTALSKPSRRTDAESDDWETTSRAVSESGSDNVTNSERDADIAAIKATARRLLVRGEREKAHTILEQGLQVSPRDASMRLLMGTAQCQTGRFEEAIELLSKLVADVPSSSRVRVMLATAYFGQNELSNAKTHLEKALRLDQDFREAHFNLAQLLLLMDARDEEAAREHYQKALALGTRPDDQLSFLLD